MTRREIRLPDGQYEWHPDGPTACLTHIRMVPCEVCDSSPKSISVLWSQRPTDVQHVRNEEAWRKVK